MAPLVGNPRLLLNPAGRNYLFIRQRPSVPDYLLPSLPSGQLTGGRVCSSAGRDSRKLARRGATVGFADGARQSWRNAAEGSAGSDGRSAGAVRALGRRRVAGGSVRLRDRAGTGADPAVESR